MVGNYGIFCFVNRFFLKRADKWADRGMNADQTDHRRTKLFDLFRKFHEMFAKFSQKFRESVVCGLSIQCCYRPSRFWFFQLEQQRQLNGLRAHISEILGALGEHISSPASPVFSTNATNSAFLKCLHFSVFRHLFGRQAS